MRRMDTAIDRLQPGGLAPGGSPRRVASAVELLKKKGYRRTPIRGALLKVFVKNEMPLSALELQGLLNKKYPSIHKTTVYRELTVLTREKIVRELHFADATKRYEIMPVNHHHHLVCFACGRIEEVELQKDLDTIEKRITKNKKFTMVKHSLEFYGVCKACQKEADV